MTAARPEDWEQIPDIDLYMDQVISYMTRQHIGLELENEETLTSAMINNYIKSGLLPRAKGKKVQQRAHRLPDGNLPAEAGAQCRRDRRALNNQMEHRDIEDFYHNYKVTLDNEFNLVAEELKVDASEEELAQLALKMAVSSYAQMLACKKDFTSDHPGKRARKIENMSQRDAPFS